MVLLLEVELVPLPHRNKELIWRLALFKMANRQTTKIKDTQRIKHNDFAGTHPAAADMRMPHTVRATRILRMK